MRLFRDRWIFLEGRINGVDADILLDSYEADVILPRAAVKTAADGSSVVYVKRGDGFEPRQVELGDRSEIQVVVEDGVGAGEEVLLGDPPDDAG